MKTVKIDEKIDVLFFERPVSDLKRYAFKIAKFLKEIDPKIKMASISLELSEDESEKCVDYYILRKQVKNIDQFLLRHKVKIIVFTNPRIPDMEMILHAHKCSVKTVMIQEGVIFEGANINDVSVNNIFATLKFIPKTISYFGILYRMCRYDSRSFIGLMKEIITIKKNITSIVAHYFTPYLIGDYVFTMGEYWEDYYVNVMKYKKSQIRIMGDHDLDGFCVSDNCEAAICYIATVLVEDGTRSKNEFDVFIEALTKAVDKETKLYIKLHPRSDETLYEKLRDHNVEFIREGKLPSTNVYIGHRSTLLARALYESDNLIIWKFANEKADFFEQFASKICMNEKELCSALSTIDFNSCSTLKREKMEKVYWMNPKGAIKSAAEMIYQYISEERIEC